MSRIAPENMTTLYSAADSKAVANTAVEDLERMQIAHCINEAANTGGYEAYYNKQISVTLLAELEANNYTIIQPSPIAKPGDVSIISWKDA